MDLRLDTRLSDMEEEFRRNRRRAVLRGMRSFLGDAAAPTSESEVPLVCLMTSGGGFRAMIAYAGAFDALHKLGIVDCVSYVSALSGSAWYGINLKHNCKHKIKGI